MSLHQNKVVLDDTQSPSHFDDVGDEFLSNGIFLYVSFASERERGTALKVSNDWSWRYLEAQLLSITSHASSF